MRLSNEASIASLAAISQQVTDAPVRVLEVQFEHAAPGGADVHEKFAELKEAAADRSPRSLGSRVKRGEIMFHHEVTNQFLWSKF